MVEHSLGSSPSAAVLFRTTSRFSSTGVVPCRALWFFNRIRCTRGGHTLTTVGRRRTHAPTLELRAPPRCVRRSSFLGLKVPFYQYCGS